MSLEIHPSSIQFIFFDVANIHPTTGPVDLSLLDVEIAIPQVGNPPSSWITCTWATGSKRVGDKRYYVVVVDTDDLTLADNTTYQPWIRIGGATGAIVKAASTLKVTDS